MTKHKVDQVLLRARKHERQGENGQARALYEAILESFPNNARARRALAKLKSHNTVQKDGVHPSKSEIHALLGLYHKGDHASLIKQARSLLERHPSSFILWNMVGAGYRSSGQSEEAESAFRRAAELNPKSSDVYKNLGMTLIELRRFKSAVEAYRHLVDIDPNDVAAYNNLGLALRALGNFDEAQSTLEKAISINSNFAEAWNSLGLVFYQKEENKAALKAYQRAVHIMPNYAAAHYNSGNVYKKINSPQDAVEAYRKAVSIKPDYVDALNNLGNVLTSLGQFREALEVLEKASSLRPDMAVVQNNLGNVWLEKDNLGQAKAYYEKALKYRPDYPEALNNLGIVLHETENYSEAVTAFRKAIALRPAFQEAYTNMGNALAKDGELEEAIQAYQKAVELNPEHVKAECAMYHQMQHICDWSAYEMMTERVPEFGITTEPVSPFALMSMEDSPMRQRTRAEASIAKKLKTLPSPRSFVSHTPGDKLRIGYFSADIHNHPCLYLTLGIFRCHDRSKFEVSIFSYGKNKSGDLRKRASEFVDHFYDISEMSNTEFVDFAREKNLDIAIDLMAHTRNSRFHLFYERLAPVQISYVGFPGTTGAKFIDYIIGDQTVIPSKKRRHYTEKVIFMPHTYLPNDNTLPISEKVTSRADFDLPDDAFVMCCFNNNYKISPREFDIWMRLLEKIDDSVLWVLETNRFSQKYLRHETRARGIDPDRLVVGKKIPHPEHMARHRHADLFVDTFNYNAHTTACEALWAGLPVVTKLGDQFAARVAASMLTSVELPELIAETEEEYEAIILNLATDRAKLQSFRDKLNDNLPSKPLFDTERNTRALENGFLQAYDLYASGEAPMDIWCETFSGR